MQLRIGDTFKNSVGKQITVKNIHNSGNRVELSCPDWASTYHHDVADIIDRIKLGHYTDYRPVKQEYEIGGIFQSLLLSSRYRILSLKPFKFESIPDGNKYNESEYSLSFFTVKNKADYLYIPPQSTTSTMKTWQKEDFLKTKILVDTPEKSRKFQELMFSLGITWGSNNVRLTEKPCLYVNNNGYISWSDLDYFRKKAKTTKEIFYNEIFNNSNNQLINNNEKSNSNTNDISSTDLSGIGGKEAATACQYSKTCKIASSSGYTGNRIQGRTATIRTGRFEIKFKAIAV